MGIGVRSFLIDRRGDVRRIPWVRMCRLFRGEPTIDFKDWAGTAVRCAVVFIEFDDRRPQRVMKTEFSVLYLDEHGALDRDTQTLQLRLIGESLNDVLSLPRRDNVVDMRPRLARKRYRERFEWTPTEDQLQTILRRCL